MESKESCMKIISRNRESKSCPGLLSPRKGDYGNTSFSENKKGEIVPKNDFSFLVDPYGFEP
jgi:hypothetical protein